MKTLIAGLLAATIGSSAMGQALLEVDFIVSGVTRADDIAYLKLDLDIENRVYSVHGTALLLNGLSLPVVGTCFATDVNGVYCTLNIDFVSVTLELNPNLSGTYTQKNGTGLTMRASQIFLQTIR